MFIPVDSFLFENGYPFFRSIVMCLGLIGFAYRFANLNIPIDLSYGVYIYHMIVINVMIQLGIVGQWQYLLVAMMITFLLAIASTFIIGGGYKNWKKMKSVRDS